MPKTYLQKSVYDAAVERINRVFDDFELVQVAFSGGKDSTVLLHLVLEVAEKRGRLPVKAMFVDLEGQYRSTIAHVTEMFDDPRIEGTWFCLPINLRNAVSNFQPHWACWDPSQKDIWVRDLPDHSSVVSDPSAFPFWKYRMEFEEFVPKYEKWLAEEKGEKIAVLVGIRSDESLNRYRTIARHNREDGKRGIARWSGLKYSTMVEANVINFYPIYDWRVEDVWTYIAKNSLPYNKLYDAMYLTGTSLHDMRICQPYGDDQRVGLDQFHKIEPDTWFRILRRVQGVNFGALYASQKMLGYRGGFGLPEGLTWKKYTKLLLSTLPPEVADQYRRNFLTFMLWWKNHRRDRGYAGMFDAGKTVKDLPDYLKAGRLESKNIPSWQRMALCLLKNDYWCHSLKFGQTVDIYERQQKLKEKYSKL
jgi:predicted phosphoadenosine phosphosulfate sulfurtransferase